MSHSNCCFLLSQEAGKVVWHSHLFKNFPQFAVIHAVKSFGIANKAELDIFLELSYFFQDSTDVGNLISGFSAFSKTSLNIWKFTVHIQLKPGLENFEHYFASVWDECRCVVVWAFFGIALSLGLKWKLTFSSPVSLLSFPNLQCQRMFKLLHNFTHLWGMKEEKVIEEWVTNQFNTEHPQSFCSFVFDLLFSMAISMSFPPNFSGKK